MAQDEHEKVKKCEYREANKERICEYREANKERICEYNREYRRNHYVPCIPTDNKKCAVYLGVYIAEKVLISVFKNVDIMPYGNRGYDFKCGGGYMIDCKSACRHIRDKADNWRFHIKHNTTADYFLCLGFDNRTNLNPEHVWLIPGADVNMKSSISISESTIHKWDDYKLDKLDDIITCCDTIRHT